MQITAKNITSLKPTGRNNLFAKLLEENRLIIEKAKEGKFGKEIGKNIKFAHPI